MRLNLIVVYSRHTGDNLKSKVKINTIVQNRTQAQLETYGAETVKEALNGFNSDKSKGAEFDASQLKRAFTLGKALHSVRDNWKENKEKMESFYIWADKFCTGVGVSYIKVFINMDIKKAYLGNAKGIEEARKMMTKDNAENVDVDGMLVAPIKQKKDPVIRTPEEQANAIMKRIAGLPLEYIVGIRDALTESIKNLTPPAEVETTEGIQEKTEVLGKVV